MKKMVVLWIIIMAALISSLLIIGFNFKGTVGPYIKLEETIEEAANGYYEENDLTLSVNETFKITIDALLDQVFIKSTKVNDDECKGYVIAKKGITGMSYKAYISCDDYQTKNYEDN